MNKICVLFLMLNPLTIQVSTTLTKTEPHAIWDVAHQLLQELKDFIELTVDASFSITQLYLRNVNNTYDYTIENIEMEVEDINTNFLNELNTLKELGKNASVDISDCLVDGEDELKNLASLVLNNFDICGQNVLKRFPLSLRKLEEAINNTLANVEWLEHLLGNCDKTDSECITDVITKIADEDDSLTAIVLDSNAKIYLNFTSWISIFNGCQISQINKMTSRGSQILADISDCVHNIINQ